MNDKTQIQLIVENMERRFSALLEHKDEHHFQLLLMDYIEYLGKQKLLAPIFDELFDEKNLFEKTVIELSLSFGIKGWDPFGKPSFITEKIATRFNIYEKMKTVLIEMRKEDDEKRLSGLPIYDPQKDFYSSRSNDLYLVQKLHNDIMEKLSDVLNNKTPIEFSDDGSLIFQGRKILISKSKGSDHYMLLKTVFKKKSKTWSYDEIWEDWYGNEEYDIRKWNRFYNASYKINQKVAQETTIKDLLIFDSKTVQINKFYL